MTETLEKQKTRANSQRLVETSNGVINQTFAAMGDVSQKEVSGVQVYLKDSVVFALQDTSNLYFRISEDDYQIIGDKYKIIRMDDRRYIFERINPGVLSSSDELLQLLTRAVWEMSGKLNIRY